MALDKSKLQALFQKAQANAKKAASAPAQKKVDERFLKMNIGSTYHLRLLYLPTQKRTSPFIENQVHRFYDSVTKEYTRVVCPTSSHILGSAGFDRCPVCKVLSDLWKRSQEGDKLAEELYRTGRRSSENYAVVYVVKDSSTENPQTGKIKILKYGFEISKFLNAECLGIAGKGQPEIDQDDIVGFEAFDLSAGRNLIIKVGKKDVRMGGKMVSFPEYETAFSRSLSAVDVDIDSLPAIFKEIRFDEDFFVDIDEEALMNYYNKFIKSRLNEVVENEEPAEEESEDIEESFEDAEPVKTVSANASKKTSKSVTDLLEEDEDFFEEDEEEVPAPAPKKKTESKKSDIDSLDLDDLLADFDD